jgi:hypothetical protein
VILRTFRLDRGSVILVSGQVDLLDEQEYAGLLPVLGMVGVSVAVVPAGIELSVLTGPAYPVEITPIAAVR